jgi:hypothetical protein
VRQGFLYGPKRKVRCLNDGRIRIEQFDVLQGRFTEQVYRLSSITTHAEAGWLPNRLSPRGSTTKSNG